MKSLSEQKICGNKYRKAKKATGKMLKQKRKAKKKVKTEKNIYIRNGLQKKDKLNSMGMFAAGKHMFHVT